MEQTSTTHLTNMRSSIMITHLLNLTYSLSGNLASSLITSTSSTSLTGDTVEGDVTAPGGVSLTQSSGSSHLSFKSSGRNGRRDNSEAEMLEMFNKYFATVIDPVIIATGIVGNALLALLFMITPLRMQPLSHVLSGLGVVDLIYMLSYALMYLAQQGVKVYDVPGACQILNFALMLSKCTQAWYIFLSHLNRLKAHTTSGSELQKRRVFNIKFAIIMIGVLVAVPLLHVLWSMETLKVASTTYCVPMRETIVVHLTLRKIEVIATVLLPLVLIAGVDIALLVKLITYLVFRTEVVNDNKDGEKLSPSGSSQNMVLMSQQMEEYCKDRSLGDSEDVENQIVIAGDLSLAFQIAFHILKEKPKLHHHDSGVEAVQHTSGDESFSNDGKTQKNISTSIISIDDKNTPCSKPQSGRDCNLCLSSSNRENLETKVTKCEHNEDLTEINDSVVDTCNNYPYQDNRSICIDETDKASVQDKFDLIYSSENWSASDSKTLNKAKQYKVTDFIFNSIKKFRLSTAVGFDKQNNLKRESGQISKLTVSNDSMNTNFSASQCGRYSSSSHLSTPRRSQPTLEDHVFPSDTAACTVTTVLLGLIFAITVLPLTYSHAVRLFLDSPTSRPSAYAMQTAILFESFVKINAVYKLFMYALVMPSFRSAIMWLLTHWIPDKITRIYSRCMWGPVADKTELVYV